MPQSPRFISSFSPSSIADIEEADLSVFSGLDMVEWRADAMPADQILKAAPVFFRKFEAFPVLFTLRTQAEGGKFDQSDQLYSSILQQILAAFNPAFVDLEAETKPEVLAGLEAFLPKLWLSYHNFQEIPKDLFVKTVPRLAEYSPAMIKIAVTPHNQTEVWQLLRDAGDFRNSHECGLIAIAMGKTGRISRLFDSPWTFVTRENQVESAPGQFSLFEVRKILEIIAGNNHATN